MNERTSKRNRRSLVQWQELIDTQVTSELSAKAFCEQQKVGYASFCKWKRRLSSTASSVNALPKPQADFIDLSDLPGSGPGQWQVVLKLGDGMELQLTRG